jgi:hypothetical protein
MGIHLLFIRGNQMNTIQLDPVVEHLRATGANFLNYRPHESGGQNRVRVWDPRWAGDQFEILTQTQFKQLKETGIELVEADDE